MTSKHEAHKQRDMSIDCFRILSCVYVICIHLNLPRVIQNRYDKTAVAFSACFDDANAFFYCICGAFLFSSYPNVLGVWNHFFKTVLFPSCFTMLVLSTLTPFGRSKSILPTISDIQLPSFLLLHKFLLLRKPLSVGHYFGPYHFICTYWLHLLYYPLLAAICDGRHDEIVRYLIWGSFLSAMISDLWYTGIQTWISSYELMPRPVCFLLVGYYLYSHKERVVKVRLCRIVCLSAIIVILYIRCLLQFYVYSYSRNERFIGYDCFFSYLNSSAYFLLFLSK